MCDTAFEIVLLGLLKLSKNASLLKAALLPDLEGGQRSGANRLHIVYYTAASALALWLLFAIIQGNRLLLLRYFAAAKVQASVCLYWQMISFLVTAAYGEIKAQQDGYNSVTDWKQTWGTGKANASVSVTATSVLALLDQQPDPLSSRCTMCLDTACEVVLLGLWKLVKNVALLRVVLAPDLAGGQRSVGNILDIVYYIVATLMSLWLTCAAVRGDKVELQAYIRAAKVQARVCLYWQLVTTFFALLKLDVPESTLEFAEHLLGASIAFSIICAAYVMVFYARVFIIWLLHEYAATLPGQVWYDS